MSSAATGSGEIEKAIQLLKAKQNNYYIQAVKDALQAEDVRKYKLQKATTHLECKRLEKKFAKERSRERERLQQIQEDHHLLLKANIKEWKANGVTQAEATARVGEASGDTGTAADTTRNKASARVITKEALNRLATPRMPVPKAFDASGRPTSASGAYVETSQDVAFLADIYRKQDHERLYKSHSLPALNSESLHTLSETDLLHKKMNLLTQLHGVLSLQEQIIKQDDGQCTVRSSVSSWKSSDFKSSRSHT